MGNPHYRLGYLGFNNPWRWASNIENNIQKATEAEFFQMYNEICLTYASGLGRDEKSFQWYFEEIFQKKVIDPEIEIKKLVQKGEGVADFFVTKRKEIHNKNLSDYKKIYSLWKEVGIKKGFDISFYPNDLDEIFN